MEKKICNKKNEKGAITLFVLLACLFFVFILTGTYISNLNRLQVQEQEVRQIQENYAKDIDRVDEIYENLSKSMKVTLSQNPPNGTWTNEEVTLTGNAQIKEGNTATIVGYAFTKNTTEEPSSWTSVSNKTEITETSKVTENGIYYFWVKDSDGETKRSNKVEVSNIDKTAPTAGTLIAKELDESGNEIKDYDLSKSLWTDKDVYIEKVDGSDQEPGSGHKNTTYKVEKGTSVIYENIQEPITLTESGTYTVTVTTEDNAGNTAENTYTIRIDKVVPTLALKHNDESGATYDGTWTKDDLYGEINIDTSSTGKTVEKYQYSYNGIVWYDISAEQVVTSIDYTIDDFNNIQNKLEWIGNLTNNGTYYFEVQEDGTLKPNNSGINSKTANSYIEIDLTNYPEASLDITVNATISSENGCDFGYATITNSATAPIYSSPTGRFIYLSGTTTTSDYTTTIIGGKTYYLHIGYSKDSSASSNQDTFIINSINFKSETLGREINFSDYTKTYNKVTFKLKEDIEKEIYVRAVYEGEQNETSKYGNKTLIKIDKKAPVIETANPIITSKEDAKAEVKVTEKGSGLKGYYISTEQTSPTESSTWVEQLSNEFTIEGLSTNSTYYLWVKDNVENISEAKEIVIGNANYLIDDTIYTGTLEQAITKASDGSTIKLLNDYTDTSVAIINKSVTFDVQNYILTRNTTITINSGKTVEITGMGKITTETTNVNTITNNGTLTVSNSITIENMSTSSSYAPIYNNSSSAVINIDDNVKISGYYRGIYNYYGTLNVNGGKIEATYQNSRAYGIYNYYGTTYITNGETRGYYGIYNYYTSAKLEMTGGKVIGTRAYGIYATGMTNIYGGRIEGKTYGIYSNATDNVTIGKQEDALSEIQPAIYGGNYGIYMNNETYSFNFYNGVIISNTKETAYRGVLNPRTGYMLYTYLDYEVEQRYCTILTPIVENITMEATPTEYTNGDVIVTITYPYVSGTVKQYSEDGVEWKDADQYVQEIVVTENKIIYARTLNESGIITEEQQIEVTNIDKEKPTITISPSQTVYSVTSSTGTANITLTITASDTGVSGLDLMQYAWAAEGEEMVYVDFTNTVTISKTKLAIGQYNLYLNVTDKAGNKVDLVQMRYTVKFEEPVCQIGSITYTTIQAAIDACSKEAGDTQTTIEMLKNTDEEFSTYEGQNIILDLKGYTIGSSSLDTPLCTNNATLQLVDSSTEKTGKLESLNGTAILNNGTFTIGDNSTSIEMEVPTIYGYKVGINNQNVLNFYDGKIQGITPIQGKVTSTPEEYGPVSTNYENGITTMQLGIVTGYEARIEWVYYTTVQEAIDATMLYQNNYKDTVTIIKDIQLKNIAEVNSNKNMILDLDGYELTIVSEKNRVINNYGNLEITDSSIEQTGEIKIESESTCYGIYNYNNGNVTVEGGTVSSSSSSSYGIYNVSTGTIEVSGGTVSSNSVGIYNVSTGTIEVSGGTVSSNSVGIYNLSTGTIEVSGGTVSSSRSSSGSNSYGIYNYSTGTIEVSGGTVSSSSSSYSYGIYNYSTGTIEVSGGTVSSSSSSSGSSSYGIYNYSTGTIEVSGGTVSSSSGGSSSSYGIYNDSTGTIEVSGGTVSSSSGYYSYGIYNADTGNVIIGSKESQDVLQGNPNIKGEYTGTSSSLKGQGLYNKLGTLEFYNGIVQGNIALAGNITKIREGYKIEKNAIDEKESIYLVEKTDEEYIVQIEENKYYSLQEAIDSIGEEEKTIEVIKDFELEEKETIKFNKNVILNLNGYTITNNYYRIENTGNFTIEDLTENKEGKIENLETIIGLLNMEDGNIMMIGGTVSSSSSISSRSYGIYNVSTGTIEVSGGTVSSSSSGIRDSYGIYNGSTGTIEVSGGTVSSSSSSSYGIYNDSTGTIEVSGGTVSSSSGYYSYGIYNESIGTITVSGGTVSSSNSNMYSYGIYNYSTGTIEVSGGTVSSSSSSSSGSSSYGIYNYSTGTIEVSGGTVSSSTSSSYSYGIYNKSTGNIVIGTKGDGLITQEEPYVKGEYTGTSTSYVGYGIYNTKGNLYFYDGKLEGTTKAVYDIITEYEENAELNYNEDETILTLSTTITPVAQIGTTQYNTLYEAISATGSTETTIKLLRNISYTINDIAITIPNTRNIILDLNGYKITSAIPEKVIQNEGILEVIDSSEAQTGTIVTSEEKTINNINGAKLTISGGTIENRTKYAIYNEGEAITKGGTVSSSSSSYNYGIYNASTGTIEVSGGTVSSSSSYSYGIYNASTGTIEVSGGTVNSSSSNSSSSYSYGIYNKSTGNIVIGTKGDGVISQENPSITATKTSSSSSYVAYGIYNQNGTLAYYDGVIKANTRSIYGNITEIEDTTELLITSETIDSKSYEVLRLQTKDTNVALVNSIEYDSIQKAVEACGTTENTITILRDSDPGATVIIGENQNITIDLNGYTINNYTELQNKGTLKITDSSEAKTGKIAGLTGIAISNSANIELIEGSISDSGYGIKNTGTLNVAGGNITNNTYGIYNDENGTVIIGDGTISSNTYGAYNCSSSSSIDINGGTILSNKYGIYNYNGTTNIATTGLTNNTYGVYNAGGITIINTGTQISNGTYGIYNSNGITNIKEGSTVQSNTGVYVSSGTLNIGETGTINSSSPIITGETYGLSVTSTGTVYMYDGQIKGKTGATQGYITYTEEGYQVANKVEGEYFVDYLALAGTVSTVAQVNGVDFSNLQSAINSVVGEETQTITLTNGIISDITFNISEGQNIVLDMNGKTISSDLDVTINNSGNLTIIDSSGNNVAKISSTVGTAIVNSGTLTLGQDDGTVEQDILTIDGTTYGIESTGTLNFYDGTINGASAVSGTITNRPDGYVIRTTTVNSKERYYLST